MLWPIIQAKMLIEGEVIASVLGAKDATVAYNPVRTVLIADDELCTTAKSRNFASAYAAGQGGALPTGDSKKGVVEAVNTIGRIYTELCMRMDSTQDPEMMLRGLVPYYMETHSYLFRGKPLDDCAKAILDRVAIRYRAPKL